MKLLIRILVFTTWFLLFFNTGLFVYPALSQSLLWGILSCILLLLTSLYNIIKGNSPQYTKWSCLVFIYLCYLIIHSYYIDTEYYRLYYYISGFIFLITTYQACRSKIISFVSIKKMLLGGLFIQLIFVYGQTLQLWPSLSPNFLVTGCCENPNVAAMYIVLIIPIILNDIYKEKQIIVYSGILVLSLIALYLLNCRTAWLAIIIPFTVFFIKRLLDFLKFQVIKKTLVVSFSISVLLFIVFLYQNKQDSADGRMLIWKLSAKEISQNLRGNGYGRFAAVYNQLQSEYFMNSQSSVKEKQNARFTAMAYNDYLEHGVDGGVVGMLLHVLLFATFIYLSYKQRNKVTFSIFSMTAIMSCVNFVIISILPWIIFLMTAGYTLSIQPQKATRIILHKILNFFLCMLTLFICYRQLQFTYGQYVLTKSKQELLSLSDVIGTSELYHRTVALQLIQKKDWQGTIEHCDKALQYTLLPSILQMKANALLQENRPKESESTLQTLRYMIPTHLGSRFQLLHLYSHYNYTQKAHDMAHEILSIVPPVKSKKTEYIQQSTQHYLNHIHHEQEQDQ